MSIKDRLKNARERIQKARQGIARPLDEDDKEALNFLIETAKDMRHNGVEAGEIDEMFDALQAWREARKNTPST